MDKPLSLRKNFSWAFIGNVANAFALWAIISMMTKLSGATMVGIFELGRTIVTPIMIITMLNLRAIQVTDTKREYLFADYFGTRLTMTVLGLLTLVIISLSSYDGKTAWVIILWGLVKSIDSVSDIIRGLFQRYERMHLSGISLMIKGSAAFITVSSLLWLTGKLTLAIGGLIFIWSLVFILYDLHQARNLLHKLYPADIAQRRVSPRFKPKVLLSLLWVALPLGIVMFLGSLQQSIPKLVLESYYGKAALGYFGPIAYPVMASILVISAMSQSASPRLANYYIHNLAAYCQLIKKLLLLALGIGIVFVLGVAVFGSFALRTLYTSEYAQYHTDFVLLSIGITISFLHFFCGCGLTAARAFKVQLFITICSCITAIITAFILIPPYGLRGTTITIILTFIVMFICSFGTLLWIINKRKRELSEIRDGNQSG